MSPPGRLTNQTDAGPNELHRSAAQEDQDQVAGQHENEVHIDLGREFGQEVY